MVVDRVAGVLERQTGRVRSAPGVVVAQHERVRRQIPLRVQVVPPERQRVARVRVPIQFYDELVIVGVVEVPLVRASVVPIDVLHQGANGIHHLRGDARDAERQGPGARRGAGYEVRARLVRSLDLRIHEKEQLVADQRSADRGAALKEAEVGVGSDLRASHRVAEQGVVAPERVRRGLILVRPALGHRVDVGTREPSLAHVEGSNGNLHLLDCVVGHRLGVGLAARRRVVQAERVVEVGPIERNVVVQPVAPREAVVAVVPWIRANQVAGAALDRGEQLDLPGINEGGRTGTPRVEHLVALRRRDHRRQLNRLSFQTKIDAQVLPQAQEHVRFGVGPIADPGGRYAIGPAHPHVGRVVSAARPRNRPILRAARHVHGDDVRVGQRSSVLVGDDAAHRGGGHSLTMQQRREAEEGTQRQHAHDRK